MKILFIHQNFPGQYRHLLKYFATRPDCEVVGISSNANISVWQEMAGVRVHYYDSTHPDNRRIHHYLRKFEDHVRRGQSVARKALKIKKEGFEPDVICVHPGWGEGLYIKDIFRNAKVISFCEFYYNAYDSDLDFEEPVSIDKKLSIRTRNATQLISIMASDWCVSPTQWQKSLYPKEIQNKITVIHDGIDTDAIHPVSNAEYFLESEKLLLKKSDEIVTFVSRSLEPYRGFHIFARALPLIQKLRPEAHILIVGADGISYGASPPKNTTYRQLFMQPVLSQLDMSKIHFLGIISRESLTALLQVSGVHIYLTYPFVLSWSMLEAMSAGCIVVGSKTSPVEEVIEDGTNGLLVDFFSPGEIAQAVDKVFSYPDQMQRIKDAARQTIRERYDLHSICLPQQVDLIDRAYHADISQK